MRRHRWRLPGVLAAALLAAVVTPAGGAVATPPPAQQRSAVSGTGSPTGSVASGAEAAPAKVNVTAPGSPSVPRVPMSELDRRGGRKVTLVTGDVVSYQTDTAGVPKVAVAQPEVTGRLTGFSQQRDGDRFYVIPTDAIGLVGAGRLDKELFDVAYLTKNGYADDEDGRMPVIVQYSGPTRDAGVLSRQTDALPGTPSPARPLPAINAAAVTVTKSQLSSFWSTVDGSDGVLGAGVERIWLDRRVHVTLDQSVPQIGAPAAWQAGYDGSGVKVAVLDTGVDDTHPDLAGRITDSRSFVGGATAKDGHGHGTHVASTIVGSGAASDGKYRGVAPGAELMVGKVLDDTGNGSDSSIIAGMQWAAQSGARIISMSLGGTPSDGRDPLSQAVNTLSAQYGSLFVVAAGNDGGSATINSPGAADAALTVAAVDKQDQMADFSSRGPRPGDYGLKPDVAAPGVNITADRADGTALGPVVDDRYTTISGTSMATPHVAGAAAILAQEHPDWSGQKLKQVLVSTAKDDGFRPDAQGAGRVDVPRAIGQHVYATGNVDFGRVPSPYTAPVDKALTYVNDGDEPVTLHLALSLATRTGPAPGAPISVAPDTVTVPAHGTAETTVTFDVTRDVPNVWYTGRITATDATGAVQVATTVGAARRPATSVITNRIVNPGDRQIYLHTGFIALRYDDTEEEFNNGWITPPKPEASMTLNAGHYMVTTEIEWWDRNGDRNLATLTAPSVDASHDVTVTFDLSRLRPITIDTPQGGVPYELDSGLWFRSDTRGDNGEFGMSYWMPYGAATLWQLPDQTGGPAGLFEGYTEALLGAAPVNMQARGVRGVPGGSAVPGGRLTLHPRYQWVGAGISMFDGRRRLPLVYAGHGTPTDLAGVDVRGALVLLDLSDLCPTDDGCASTGTDRVTDAAAAGAAGVVGFTAEHRRFLDPFGGTDWGAHPIPTLNLPANEGQVLRVALTRGPVSIEVSGAAATPYLYTLAFHEHGDMPEPRLRATAKELVRTDNRIHAERPGLAIMEWQAARPKGWRQNSMRYVLRSPGTISTYTGPVGTDVAWVRNAAHLDVGPDPTTGTIAWQEAAIELHTKAGTRVLNWGAAPRVSSRMPLNPDVAPYTVQMCFACRNGNRFDVGYSLSHDGTAGLYSGDLGRPDRVRLYKDGTEMKAWPGIYFFAPMMSYDLPPERASYRLETHSETPQPDQLYARTNDTTWTFTSQRRDSDAVPTRASLDYGVNCAGWYTVGFDTGVLDPDHRQLADPCQPVEQLHVGYDLDLDLDNTVPEGSSRTITLNGYYNALVKNPAHVTGLTLWLSFDDGAHWTKVRTRAAGGNAYTATVHHPARAATTGAVSMKVQAVDSHGNTITQTIPRAYGLKAVATHHGNAV